MDDPGATAYQLSAGGEEDAVSSKTARPPETPNRQLPVGSSPTTPQLSQPNSSLDLFWSEISNSMIPRRGIETHSGRLFSS